MADQVGEKGLGAETSEQHAGDLKRLPTVVDGTTQIYEGGRLRLIPTPSASPDDPLNFSAVQKGLAIFSMCFFGAIAISMQQMVASLLPVFMLEYAGLDPMILNNGGLGAVFASMAGGDTTFPPSSNIPPAASLGATGGFPTGANSSSLGHGPPPLPPMTGGNPLEALSNLPGAQPLSRVNLLISLPVLFVGISNYVLIPASVAFGRRAVILFCVVLATLCTAWSGLSTSLSSHIASRCLQAVGAGAVESLIPLIVQDMTFLHQRSKALSVIWASQGIVIISFGLASSYITARLGWRWLYFIGTIITAASALCVILFVPETRWPRAPEELRGEPSSRSGEPISGNTRRRSLRARFGVCANGGARPKDGLISFAEIVKTLALPIVIYLVLVNAAFIGISLGSQSAMSTVLLAPPYSWPFESLGLVVIALAVSSLFVMLIGGYLSDMVTNRLARRNGGKREAEMNLWNLVFPFFCGVFGCLLLGVGGEYVYRVHWMAIVSATSILIFAFSTANIVASVVVVESYPRLAGPVLVNVASFRNIVGFAFTYGIPSWIAERGYMGAFGIFAGVIGLLSLFLPLFMFCGKRLRKSTRFISGSVSHAL